MYYFPTEPPYFLLVVGLFMGISCGTAFDATLKRNVKAWSADRKNVRLANSGKLPLQIPFVGIASGVGLFLTAGLSIFGFPEWLAASLAIPMTLLTMLFLWVQLKGVFKELDRGGSAALDLDSWE